MVGLLLGFMVVTMLITLLPAFVEMIDFSKGNTALNCRGYIDAGGDSENLTYNASIGQKSSIACLAMSLYIPYIVLAILIGLVVKILYERQGQQQPY